MIYQPAADRLRPASFDEVAGQKRLVGPGGILRRMVESGKIGNLIFYGPPGTGKTTVANIIAAQSGMRLHRLNATTASLSDVKEIAAETSSLLGASGILLYLDEIQYFNKKQQQSLLQYIEDGRITLIASTTENPYFYVYDAVLSRSSVFEFKPVSAEEMLPVLRRACEAEGVRAEEETLLSLGQRSGGDVRRAITLLERAAAVSDGVITPELLAEFTPSSLGAFDRDGDVHYDLLSALQKSIRGSDPDAAVFYLARLLEGGDLISPCRRLQVIASEDVGQAYPMAPVIVRACVESAMELGLPEARIPLAHAAVLLATAPKSNSAYEAMARAVEDVAAGRGLEVPPHLRSHGNGKYKYPHAFENHYVNQQYLPDDLVGRRYYEFGENKTEAAAAAYWEKIKGGK